MKKTLSVLIMLGMMTFNTPGIVPSASSDYDGYITIASSSDFANISDFTANYVITADITVSAPLGGNSTQGGNLPTTTWRGDKFSGTIIGDKGNGENPVVTLTLADDTNYGLAMIGYLAEGGVVENIITVGTVSGKAYVAGIVGANYGTIRNCINKAEITGTSTYLGGITAYNEGLIELCANIGDVTTGNQTVGGIAGANAGTIQKSYNVGTVGGSRYLAGIAGTCEGTGAGADIRILDCFNAGTITPTGAGTGGIAYNVATTNVPAKLIIERNYNVGVLSGNSSSRVNICSTPANPPAEGENYSIKQNYYASELTTRTDTVTTGNNLTSAANISVLSNLIGFSSDVWQNSVDDPYSYNYPQLRGNPYMDKRPQLEAPTNISVSEGTVSFGAVGNAGSYKIKISKDGESVFTDTLTAVSCDISSYLVFNGEYIISVYAIPTNSVTYANSKTAEYTYKYTGGEAAQLSGLQWIYNSTNDTYDISWTAVSDVSKYEIGISVEDNAITSGEAATNSYTLAIGGGVDGENVYSISITAKDSSEVTLAEGEIIVDARFGGGNGLAVNTPYLVYNLRQLNNVRLEKDSFFKQMADITEPFTTPIEEFGGSYVGDGDSPKIIRLEIVTSAGATHAAFINKYNKNNSSGGITNIKTTGWVTLNGASGQYAGALIAEAAGASSWCGAVIRNCVNEASVTKNDATGDHGVGGLVGFGNSSFKIYDSVNTGRVISGGKSVGGIIGRINKSGVISGCVNKGHIDGGDFAGGVAGMSYAPISKSANHGTVTSSGTAGGICGTGTKGAENSLITIEECYNNGEVTGSYYAGGIIGRSTGLADPGDVTTIKNCFNTGAVYGELATGGIIGAIGTSGAAPRGVKLNILNCYDIGNVDTSLFGLMLGEISEVEAVTNSYFLSDQYVTTPDNFYGTPITESSLRDLLSDDSTYLESIWEKSEGYDYPQLINAPYEKYYLKINIVIGANGTINTKNTLYVLENETVAVTITPDEGYYIGSVLFNEVSKYTNVHEELIYTTEPITGDSVIAVTFEAEPLPNAIPELTPFTPSLLVAYAPLTLTEGSTYEGAYGIIFGEAKAKYGDYERTEYGILFSKTPVESPADITLDNAPHIAKGTVPPNKDGQYGIGFYGDGIKSGETYYTRSYAIYESPTKGRAFVYGGAIVEFSPTTAE